MTRETNERANELISQIDRLTDQLHDMQRVGYVMLNFVNVNSSIQKKGSSLYSIIEEWYTNKIAALNKELAEL